MKVCTRCRLPKPLSTFSSVGNTKRSNCKECRADESRKRRRERREEINRRDREKYNSEAARKWNTHLKRTYGIDADTYKAMLDDQNGGCAICGVTEDGSRKRLCVDHDHNTGKVRGILCTACNQMLGRARDNQKNLILGAAYLQKHNKNKESK